MCTSTWRALDGTIVSNNIVTFEKKLWFCYYEEVKVLVSMVQLSIITKRFFLIDLHSKLAVHSYEIKCFCIIHNKYLIYYIVLKKDVSDDSDGQILCFYSEWHSLKCIHLDNGILHGYIHSVHSIYFTLHRWNNISFSQQQYFSWTVQ